MACQACDADLALLLALRVVDHFSPHLATISNRQNVAINMPIVKGYCPASALLNLPVVQFAIDSPAEVIQFAEQPAVFAVAKAIARHSQLSFKIGNALLIAI